MEGFSSALETWKDIDLTNLQKTLDQQGLEIVDNQKENLVGRKKLAESTRGEVVTVTVDITSRSN